MARNVEQPVTVDRERGGTTTTHPAFGQISASRVDGAANLYGSDFTHHAYMTITVRRSRLDRDLSQDWHFAGNEIISISLSEAQWATFVSSPNVGMGVPCTIEHIQGQRMPLLPPPPERTAQFGSEVDEKLAESLRHVRDAIAEVDKLCLSKAKAEALKGRLQAALRELQDSLPFIAKSFAEHAEVTVEKAKAEVHGYMVGAIQRAGIETIVGRGPLLIEDKSEDHGAKP